MHATKPNRKSEGNMVEKGESPAKFYILANTVDRCDTL